MSEPQQGGGSVSEPDLSHSGSTMKSEPTEEESRVPRDEAKASRDCAAAPPTWDNDDVFQGGRGVVEEKGNITESESDNLARRLNEFLERQGRNQSVEKDEYDRRFEEEMEGVPIAEEEDEPAINAEGVGTEDQAEEPKTKMPRTELPSI
eukprot:3216423-Amphidinium_carterae.2